MVSRRAPLHMPAGRGGVSQEQQGASRLHDGDAARPEDAAWKPPPRVPTLRMMVPDQAAALGRNASPKPDLPADAASGVRREIAASAAAAHGPEDVARETDAL